MARPSAHLKIKAPAKINLFLNILRKCPDGYHDLYSVFQMVGLYDELIFEEVPQGMTLVSTSGGLPVDDRNLVIRATRSLARATGIKSGVRVILKKKIPIGAGLGGGSSDAAATLMALNRLWRLGLSRDDLAKIGQDLGSDVPFFLHGPTAFVSGRGEKVVPCVLNIDRWLVIINPGFEVSTRWVYEQFSSVRARVGSQNSWLTNIQENIKIQGSSKFKLYYSDITLHNDLESITESRYPVVKEMKECLRVAGAEGVLMSGSGPTVFGIFKEEIGAYNTVRKLKPAHPDWKIWAVKSLRRSPI
ncbi:MAG: 4-(cytidine 5'-diphospho)-2-C-methyl-D-erythritol kinase [Nitrospira sp.]|nr:4-(cytidine 5'-diphospho)-2-C-methyl-D-erythritol kinase [Nitrospira sp.]